MIARVFILCGLIVFSSNVYSQFSTGAGAALLLKSIKNLIVSEYTSIKANLTSMKSYGKALLDSKLQSGKTIGSVLKELHILQEKFNNKAEIGLYDFEINYRNSSFKVGGIAPSTCIRQKNSEILSTLATEIFPNIKTIKNDLRNNITNDLPTLTKRDIKSSAIYEIYEAKKEKINPFNIDKNISFEELKEYSKVIEYLVNQSPPSSISNKINDYDYHSKRLRYESFVQVVQDSLMNHISMFVSDGSSYSKNELIKRLEAKFSASNLSEALSLKFEAGAVKELTSAIADGYLISDINNDIRKDIVALTAILATKATDDMAKSL